MGQVEESRYLLQALMDNSSNVVTVVDLEQRFLLVNRRFQELFDVTASDVLGRRPDEVLGTEDALVAYGSLARDVMTTRGVVECEAAGSFREMARCGATSPRWALAALGSLRDSLLTTWLVQCCA